MGNRSTKISVGLRLSKVAVGLLKAMAEKDGISQASVVELAVRDKARKDKVRVPEEGKE